MTPKNKIHIGKLYQHKNYEKFFIYILEQLSEGILKIIVINDAMVEMPNYITDYSIGAVRMDFQLVKDET